MISLFKIKSRLKNTKAQALLLVMIISMFSMALVLGVVERTNKQLTIQRQNAEYQIGFSNATTAIAGLKALIDNGTVVPGSVTAGNNLFINGQLTSVLPNDIASSDYRINLLPFDSSASVYSPVKPDSGLLVEQFNKEKVALVVDPSNPTIVPIKDVTNVSIDCPNTIKNVAVYVQFIYRVSSTQIGGDNFTTVCQGTDITDLDWQALYSLNPASVLAQKQYSATLTGNHLTYSIPAAKRKLLYVKVTPKVNFPVNPSVPSTVPLLVKLTDATGTLLGSSVPVQGTAIGYGKNGRNSTIYFKISNIPQQPAYFDYVMFEGSN